MPNRVHVLSLLLGLTACAAPVDPTEATLEPLRFKNGVRAILEDGSGYV